jgi:hypothetical protein
VAFGPRSGVGEDVLDLPSGSRCAISGYRDRVSMTDPGTAAGDGDRHIAGSKTAARVRLHRAASRSPHRGGSGSDRGCRSRHQKDIAELRTEIREAELRLEAKIEAMKADILNRVFGLILGTLVVNIVTIVGAMFAVA